MKRLIQMLKISILPIILAFTAAAFLANIQTVKAYDNRIFFDPSKPTVEVGQHLIVTVMVDLEEELRSISVGISWTPGFLNCTSVTKGTFLDPSVLFMSGVIDNTAGTVTGYAWTWTDVGGKNGIGSIIVVNFTVLQLGGSPIEFIIGGFGGTGMKNVDGDDMTFTAENGYATLVQTLSQHIVWTDPDTGDVHGFDITTVSNSTVGTVNFDQPNLSINFTVEGPLDTVGVCNVTIPRSILECPDDIENWMIFLNSTNISDNCTKTRDDYYTYIYIPYNHSTNTLTVTGTWVIPEFSTITLMMTLITMALITTATIKLIHRKRNQ